MSASWDAPEKCPTCGAPAYSDLANFDDGPQLWHYLPERVAPAPVPEPPSAAYQFFRKVWDAARDGYREIDGGDIQDWAHELGLLEKVHVDAPCGEGCRCEEYIGADFPTDCYRPVPEGARVSERPAPRYQVGCERLDGTLNIHKASETCEVCGSPPQTESSEP